MNATALEKFQAAFPDATCKVVLDSVVIDVQPDNLETTLSRLKTDPEFNCGLLLDVTGIDYKDYPETKDERFCVVYTIRNWEDSLLVQVRTPVADPKTGITSASHLWGSALWGERETWDQYGIHFQNHPDLRRILNHYQFEGHPLRKDYDIGHGQICTSSDSLEKEIRARLAKNGVEESTMKDINTEIMFLNLGPSHPATHGAIRILTALDGETIMANVNEIGYLHRGFEKNSEQMTYNQVIPLTDRLNYCSSMMNNIAYVKAMGGLTNYWYLYNEREAAYDLISRLTGARLTSSFTRIGGMYRDFYEGWESDLELHLKAIEKGISDSLKLILQNRIVHERTQGVCVLSAEDALSYGFTGPTLRASGVPFDLRKDAPYYNYESFDFEIPVGSKGDIYDRIMLRFEEMFQSIRIIRQAMKSIPGGPVFIKDSQVALPVKAEVYNNIEGLANHFKLIFEGVKTPAGEWYDSYEAANGELGFHFVSDGSGQPYKLKVRPPCFYIMGGFHKMVEGNMIADAVINLGSINIIGGELDR